MNNIKYAILTSSDSGHAGKRKDIGGDAIAEIMSKNRHTLTHRALLPDDLQLLTNQLRQWADDPTVDLILTTGGTGLAPRDVIPQATLAVIEYQIPGIPEAMRAQSLKITNMAMLSRATAGIANKTLIINLPGNPKGAIENLQTVLPILTHAIQITQNTHHGDHPIH